MLAMRSAGTQFSDAALHSFSNPNSVHCQSCYHSLLERDAKPTASSIPLMGVWDGV